MALIEKKKRETRLRWFENVQKRCSDAQCEGVRGYLWAILGEVEVGRSIRER